MHIRYDFLSRESKIKLEELLSNWSKWHAQHCSSSKDSYEALECGEETYFPALQFGTEKSTVSFLMDNQVRKKQNMDCVSLKYDSVPLYDREYAFALTLADGSTKESRGLEPLNASRCFNCGSYSHSLKECPKPRDNVAVSNARKQLQSRTNHIGGPRVPTRYYHTPRGKYDGLKPGALDTETRELLGLGELDPPPWLNRMRELGYPPGYLDVEDEDQPSGITIFADEESKKETEDNVKVDVSEPRKKRSVDFPGINAPVPENGDQSYRAASQIPPDLNSSTYLSNNRSNYCPELISRERSSSQRWRSGSTDGLFPGYAEELDSFMSGYSHSSRDLGLDYDRKPGTTNVVFAGDNHEFNSFMYGRSHSYNDLSFGYNSESGSVDGFSGGYRREFDFVPGYSPSYRDFGPNYNSESGQMDSFSGGYRREFDFMPGYSPSYREFSPIYSSESRSPFSFSHFSFANLRH